MKVIPVEIDVERFAGRPGSSRSAGLHASQIYRDLEVGLGRYSDGEDSAEFRRRRGTYQLGGFCWERVFERGFADLFAEQGRGGEGRYLNCNRLGMEVGADGIAGSPDILDVEEERVIDTKMTWKSSRRLGNLEKEFWGWLVQQKAYCHMVGWRRGGLRVFCVNGDYRESGPQVVGMDLEFTDREIRENWEMLKAHAQRKGWL